MIYVSYNFDDNYFIFTIVFNYDGHNKHFYLRAKRLNSILNFDCSEIS